MSILEPKGRTIFSPDGVWVTKLEYQLMYNRNEMEILEHHPFCSWLRIRSLQSQPS